MKRVFLDTNVALDVIERREPFWRDSVMLLELSARGRIKTCISAISLATIAYLLEEKYHPDEIRNKLLQLLQSVESLPTSAKAITQALLSELPDIEDEIQYFTAFENHCTLITRDEGFTKSHPGVMNPDQYLQSLES